MTSPKFIEKGDETLINSYSFASDEVVNDVKDIFPIANDHIISRNTVRGVD